MMTQALMSFLGSHLKNTLLKRQILGSYLLRPVLVQFSSLSGEHFLTELILIKEMTNFFINHDFMFLL